VRNHPRIGVLVDAEGWVAEPPCPLS
jgi:hypothetical protein